MLLAFSSVFRFSLLFERDLPKAGVHPRIKSEDRLSGSALGSRVFLHRNASALEQGLQLACLEHLTHDVATADKLTLHVKLRDRWPIGIGFDAATEFVVLEHVEALIRDAQVIENLYELS